MKGCSRFSESGEKGDVRHVHRPYWDPSRTRPRSWCWPADTLGLGEPVATRWGIVANHTTSLLVPLLD